MKLKDYFDLLDSWSIFRRYFVMNGFDGALATFGILISAMTVGMSGKEIIFAVLGSGIAMFVSGFWGAYIVEYSERKKEVKDLSRKLHRDLEKTLYGKAVHLSSIVAGLIDGISPLIFSIINILPIIVSEYLGILSLEAAIKASIILSTIILFALGAFLGKVCEENVILFGAKMLLSIVFVIIIIKIVGKFA